MTIPPKNRLRVPGLTELLRHTFLAEVVSASNVIFTMDFKRLQDMGLCRLYDSFIPNRHGGTWKLNTVLLDGHAETFSRNELLCWPEESYNDKVQDGLHGDVLKPFRRGYRANKLK